MPVSSAPGSTSRPSTADELVMMMPELTGNRSLDEGIKSHPFIALKLSKAKEAENFYLNDESFQADYDIEVGKNKRGKSNALTDLDSKIKADVELHGKNLDQISAAIFEKITEALRSYLLSSVGTAGLSLEPELDKLLGVFLPDASAFPVLTAYISKRKTYLAAKVEQLYHGGAALEDLSLEDSLPVEISEEAGRVFLNGASEIRKTLLEFVATKDKVEAERARAEAEALKAREEAERKNKAVTDGFTRVAGSLVALNGVRGLNEQLLVDSSIKDAEIELELAVEKRFDIHDLPSFTPAPVADRFGAYNQLAHKAALLERANSGASSEQKEAARIQCGIELHRIVQDYLRQFLANLQKQVFAAKDSQLLPTATADVVPLFRGLEAKIDELLTPLAPTDWAKRVEKATATIVAALPAPAPAPAPVVSGPAMPPPLPPMPPSFPSTPARTVVEPDWDRLNTTIDDLTRAVRYSGSPLNIQSIARQLLETLRGDLAQQLGSGESDADYQSRLQNLVWPLASTMATQLQGFATPAVAAPEASDIAQLVAQILVEDYGVGSTPVKPQEEQKSRLRRAGEGLLKLGAVAGLAVAFDKCDGTDRLVDGYQRMTASHPSAQVAAPMVPPAPVGGDVTPAAPETTASTVDWVKCDHLDIIPSVRDGLPKCGDTDIAAQITDKLAFVQCIGATQQGAKAFGTTEFDFEDPAVGTQPKIGTDAAYATFKRSMKQLCADEGTGVYAIPIVKR